MPTIFIALQCCQCSTMQVKQQKKSSNKWSCVVCNQKQSVRKVYAQGFMAKDVRKFVQSFNMSRQLAEHNRFLLEDEQKETLEIEEDHQLPVSNCKKKRIDWSEYIDPEKEDDRADEKLEEEFELNIVTEMPRAVFRKPKLKNYSAKFDTVVDEGEFKSKTVIEMPKSVRLKNYSATVNTAKDQAIESSRSEWIRIRNRFYETKELQQMCGISKRRSFSTKDDDDEKFEKRGPWRNQSVTAKNASKWSCYITEDTDNLLPANRRDLKVQAHPVEINDPFEINELNDQKVEEDIHPDFL